MAVPAIHGKSQCVAFTALLEHRRRGPDRCYQGVASADHSAQVRGHERNAVFAAELLAAAMQRAGWAADIAGLVPVPMSWLRGAAAVRPCTLATALGKQLGLRVMPVVRRLRTGPVRRISPHDRAASQM